MIENPVITQTKKWITTVVIGCNFCPFAAKVVHKDSVRYIVLMDVTTEGVLDAFEKELLLLDSTEDVVTTFIILPNTFNDFGDYLDLVEQAESFISDNGYDGVYQVASFHPEYCFAGADNDDAANYTNRSVYPMLHILREDSITYAIENFPNPDSIPNRNVEYAHQKGLAYMKLLRDSCFDIGE